MISKTILEGLTLIGILGFVFIIMNAVFLGIIYFTQRKVKVIAEWPSTMGTVRVSKIEYQSSGESGANYPVVYYSYQVSGQPYESNHIAPGGEVGGVGAAKVAARYPVGASVSVFYNPQKPSEAFLERKAQGQIIMWVVLVIIDLSLCVFAPAMWWMFK